MLLDYPYALDARGRTATTDEAGYLRDLIEQVLMTAPGERVNRPTFGSGLMQLVFGANSDAFAGAVQASIRAALQEWLGHLIEVTGMQIETTEASISVSVAYTSRRTQQVRVERFTRSL
jgi:uncharacterized protein